tara:strand:- start:311 stop:865 length:555 start_codon:yes stop_codon:yes gene_type:complete
MRLLMSIILFGPLWCNAAKASDSFLDAMDLVRAGHMKEARSAMLELAEAGDCDAQSQLSAMLMLGNGGKSNFKEGFKWLTKSAEQGEPLSQMTMGDLHYNKSGVTNLSCSANCPDGAPTRDLGVAYKWYLLAERRAFDDKDKAYVAMILADIRPGLTQADKAAGEKLADEWKPSPRMCELRHYY